jgi:hypothetical protein
MEGQGDRVGLQGCVERALVCERGLRGSREGMTAGRFDEAPPHGSGRHSTRHRGRAPGHYIQHGRQPGAGGALEHSFSRHALCVCVCVCVCVQNHRCARTRTCTHTHARAHTHTHIHTHTHTHTSARTHTHTHSCTQTYTHNCTHMHTLKHTHTHTWRQHDGGGEDRPVSRDQQASFRHRGHVREEGRLHCE